MARARWLLIAVVGLALTVAVLGCSFRPTRIVPDLENQTLDEAHRLARAAGLKLIVAGEVEADIAAGCVARQQPLAGSDLRRGRPITVWVSTGPVLHEVPDLAGLTIPEASERLFAVKMRVGEVRHRYSPDVEPGKVAETEPGAGTMLPNGSPVNLSLSDGPEPSAVVPDLIGRTLGSARALLAQQGLVLGRVHHLVTTEYYEGRVLGQEPRSGTKVMKGTAVSITVSAVLD